MAIVQTFVRGTAGVASAVSKYIGDRTLYKLMVTEGSMHVVRGGEVVEVNQTDVVPGDIVRLTVRLKIQVFIYSTSYLWLTTFDFHSLVLLSLIWQFFKPKTSSSMNLL